MKSIFGGDATGAGEALEIEYIPLLFCEAALSCKGCKLVEASLVVGVANEVWLGLLVGNNKASLDKETNHFSKLASGTTVGVVRKNSHFIGSFLELRLKCCEGRCV